jgi:hypothetical protein
MATPEAFLGNASHRITFHFTPRHASRSNQIEVWFSIPVRKLFPRGNFASKEHLQQSIESFVACFECHDGKALPLNDEGQGAGGMTGPRGFGFSPGCTRLSAG